MVHGSDQPGKRESDDDRSGTSDRPRTRREARELDRRGRGTSGPATGAVLRPRAAVPGNTPARGAEVLDSRPAKAAKPAKPAKAAKPAKRRNPMRQEHDLDSGLKQRPDRGALNRERERRLDRVVHPATPARGTAGEPDERFVSGAVDRAAPRNATAPKPPIPRTIPAPGTRAAAKAPATPAPGTRAAAKAPATPAPGTRAAAKAPATPAPGTRAAAKGNTSAVAASAAAGYAANRAATRGLAAPAAPAASPRLSKPGTDATAVIAPVTDPGPATATLPAVTMGGTGPDSRRGRRAVRPTGPVGRAQFAAGALLTNRRAWAVAAVTVLTLGIAATPIRSFLNDLGPEQTADIYADETRVPDAELGVDELGGPSATKDGNATTAPSPSARATQAAERERNIAASRTRDRGTKNPPRSSSAPARPSSSSAAPSTSASQSSSPTNTGSLMLGGGTMAARSGHGWGSGVYIPGSSSSKTESFAKWRGSDIDVVVDWSARSSWSDITNPDWLYNAWKGTPYTKVFGVAPIPEGDGSSLAACAQGAYDEHWRTFGKNIKAAGLDDETIVRLGWEFNGDWYKWSAHKPEEFAGCFRKVVLAAESQAPQLRWDWNVNRGRGQSVTDATKAYPGDEYVDIVGIDSYDQWPGATNEASWAEHYSGDYGLKFWVDFAKKHGKQVSVPEWGVYPGSGSNGGDNPYYIEKMHQFFESLGDTLAYEAYFNESAGYYGGAIQGPTQNPRAAAKYAALF